MRGLLTLALSVSVIVSAIAVVTVQHKARRNFTELRNVERERDTLQEEWSRLQLEQSTWAAHDRVDGIARQQLDMSEPTGSSLFFLIP